MPPHQFGYPPHHPHYYLYPMYPAYTSPNQTHPITYYSGQQHSAPPPPHWPGQQQSAATFANSARDDAWSDALPPSDFDFDAYAFDLKLSLHERICLEEMGFAGERLEYVPKETATKAGFKDLEWMRLVVRDRRYHAH